MFEQNVLPDCQTSISTNELHDLILGREMSRRSFISIEYFSLAVIDFTDLNTKYAQRYASLAMST